MDTKEFKKRQAAQAQKQAGHQGVFSGRGIGVPVGGAIDGSADGSKYLGRPRRKRMTGDQGSPSQSADSHVAFVMSRVNKNVDPLPMRPMFPEQDGSKHNKYNGMDSKSEKLHNTKSLVSFYLDEERVVANPKYSLLSVDLNGLDQMSEDINLGPISIPVDVPTLSAEQRELIDTALSVGGELVRDVSAAVVAGIPVIGTGAAAGFVYSNMRELKRGQRDAVAAIDDVLISGREEDRERMLSVAHAMFDDYIDLLESIVLLVPIIGPTRGIWSVFRKLLTFLKKGKVTSVLGLSGSGFLSAVRSQIFASPIFKFCTRYIDEGLTEPANIPRGQLLSVFSVCPATLVTIGDIDEDFIAQREEWENLSREDRVRLFGPDAESDFKYRSALYGIVGSDIEHDDPGRVSRIRQMISDKYNELRASGEIGGSAGSVQEGKKMDSEKLLRAYIRETIYHSQTQPMYDAQPQGYEYRQPPASEQYDEDYPSEQLSASEFAVNVPTSAGSLVNSPRPRDLKEEALRRIIRRKLQEEKKKIVDEDPEDIVSGLVLKPGDKKKKSDKEIDEFNTVGSVAPGGMGPALPLGRKGKGNAMDSIWPWKEKK
mgnify:CR=1 FL=1